MAAKYSLFERGIARLLGSAPGLKAGIKSAYRCINYLVYRKGPAFNGDDSLKKISDGEHESFFGYYDKSPVNSSNTKVLYHSSRTATRRVPEQGIPLDIMVYDTGSGEHVRAASTLAYNWQQGARLQWLDDVHFIFNDFDKVKHAYCSRVFNADTMKLVRTVGLPVYDCHHDFALSLNFDTLDVLRPDYGYRNMRHGPGWLPVDTADDGIYSIDLQSSTKKLLITIEEMIALQDVPGSQDARHYFNHIMISPDGRKFIFLHRWFIGQRRYDSLIISDRDGSRKRCLSNDTMVSHCCWYGNNRIISYMRDRRWGDGFYCIDVESGAITPLGVGVLESFGDGHPSIFVEDMIFDTYPNRGGMKELMMFNMRSGALKKRGEFLEPLSYSGETRCDLHPKWSLDGKTCFVDSVHEGRRFLYWLQRPGS